MSYNLLNQVFLGQGGGNYLLPPPPTNATLHNPMLPQCCLIHLIPQHIGYRRPTSAVVCGNFVFELHIAFLDTVGIIRK